ncbi:MAG: polysaccharide biosynthesis tyrosine autokinase [Nitrospira sp.]|nr:polysaccharide biosynthesis tyrosine autokinase [Nitrospira sp.]
MKTLVVDEAEQTLSEYLSICWRHRWLILSVAASFGIGAAVWSFFQMPIYQAKATVVIENLGPGALERDKSYYPDNSPEYFQTHFELMKSHQVLQRTARLLKLSDRPEYQSKPLPIKEFFEAAVPGSLRALWSPAKKEGGTVVEAEEELIKQFSQKIEIMPIRGARLVHVTANSVDPEFAALMANTLVSVYIERNQELTANSKEQAAHWFTTHLDELREKVQSSQQALYLFRAKHGLLTGEERKTVAAHTLAELNSQLVKVEMAKAEALSRFQQIRSVLNPQGMGTSGLDWSKLDSQIQVLNSPLIQTLRAQEITVSAQVAELSEKYGPLHPKLTHVKAELQDLRQRIQQEVQKIYDSVKHQYDMTLAQDRAVKEAITRYNTDKIRLEQNEIEHSMLERDAESSQHLYEVFLKATKETDLSSGMRTNNVYLADPAIRNSIPAKPKTKLNIMLGILAGFMSGVGLTIFVDGRNRKFMAPADVERYLPNVSLLGVVPLLPKEAAQQKSLVPPNAVTPAAESFRIIRTSLLLSSLDMLPSRILITSPGENEGKTTLAVNLAMAMAQLEDTQVVLIDVDFRNQQVHPIYEVDCEGGEPKGLAHLLRGEASMSDVVHQTFIPNLAVIPNGGRPANSTELLHSKSMHQLLDWGARKECHIILDCPPVLPIADAAVLASKVDGVLLVVSAGETTREACRLAIQRIKLSGGRLLGVVMQKAPVADSPYYYGGYRQLS